ncbi:hypothetical protein LEP1GSC036_1883 [Leptospira weilii str. 2006001853]|uniref:Uncharacterized protein n=2 Tax=Leptospira weilii TaxID=28184 RepID=A0A828YXJ5_9LEPT|nr:hypothetical protein [Leptospira weilii]EKR62152.1 hypothetical protein LEP1GSC036_1883 [Leptospira weilii str. 2006001853]EMM74445.1 hypothetical protein LEP1GSC038_0273 [Leptospira weilii str. 2006001855]MCL8265765.1 hypothetical protein [Leptospira weilii]
MIRKILFQSLILFCLSDCTGSKIEEPIAENYALYLLLTTTSFSCFPQTYTNPWSFTDTNGDVKAGFLNTPGSEVDYLDLISGNVQDNETNVAFSLTLGSIPDTIGVQGNSNITEYEWFYHFHQGENSFKIGIIPAPKGIPQQIPFQNLEVLVWRNLSFIGGCGNLNVQTNTANWICEKNTLPDLRELSKTESISVEATTQNKGIRYSDCR